MPVDVLTERNDINSIELIFHLTEQVHSPPTARDLK
jgi:hypothetical protein